MCTEVYLKTNRQNQIWNFALIANMNWTFQGKLNYLEKMQLENINRHE